jgi:hypothetical protein
MVQTGLIPLAYELRLDCYGRCLRSKNEYLLRGHSALLRRETRACGMRILVRRSLSFFLD